jgi:16S rRNA (guanine966-N2)-methyltransferase
VRETLFNWLAPVVHGARCADLFAGSGALGLEALSRGAASCDFVETSGPAVRAIADHLDSLDAGTRGRCHRARALDFIERVEHSLDLVFIDPPFGLGLAQPTLDALLRPGVLAAAAQLYLEMGRGEEAPQVPSAWTLWREKTAGEVTSRLYQLPEVSPGL